MAADLPSAMKAVLKRLGEVVAQDGELRLRLGELVKAVLALADESGTEPAAVAAPRPAPQRAPPAALPSPNVAAQGSPLAEPELTPGPMPEPAREPAPALIQATEAAAPAERLAPAAAPFWQISDEDLPDLEKRCLLKAEAAQWAVQRQRFLRAGADYHKTVEPRDRDLIGQAKALPDCFLWMIRRDGPAPSDPLQYEEVSGCFRTAAAAVRLLRDVLASADESELFVRALQVGAEAQSALRSAVAAIGGKPDLDQIRLFSWLRATASERQLLIPRFMRADDQAEAAAWPGLLERISQAADQLRFTHERLRHRGKLFGKVRYHVQRIAGSPEDEHTDDWQRVVEVTAELLKEGLQPSNRELRELLLPVLDTLPQNVVPGEGFGIVLREIDRYLASRPLEADAVTATPLSPDVHRAAELLRGRAVVLIGGQKRDYAASALTAALQLHELIWLEGSHSSYVAFEPHVARADVALVLLAVRWSAHSFAEVKAFCDKYAKPLVRLPAGYNANQVAYHILGQVGERLAASPLPR